MADAQGLGQVDRMSEDADTDDEEAELEMYQSSSESEDEDDDDIQRAGRQPPNNLAAMLGFHPHLIARPLQRRHRAIVSNESLISHLLETNAILTQETAKAMGACSRDQFVPGGQRQYPDIFADSPMPVTGHGFNISAPHMHATCLESLDLKPGHKVLDVGSGSGLLSAYAAMLVGKSGAVDGIDSQKQATALARRNIRRQERSNKAFAETAAPCCFYTHNVFMPDAKFQGQYDRVVVGASCLPDRLSWLLSLLKPSGGILLTPVYPSDLQKITKAPDGTLNVGTLSQVRFSSLELPKEIVLFDALLKLERAKGLELPELQSTFASDVASISGSMSSPMAGSSLGSEQSNFGRSLQDTPSSSSWPRRMTKFFSACSSGAGSERSSLDEESSEGGKGLLPPPSLDVNELGPTDAAFIGSNWSLPAHKSVLRNRSELFRAQHMSGMRDAEAAEIHVPEHFAEEAVDIFLRYCYTDKLDSGADAELIADCLAVAVYYGTPHLVQLCEISLAEKLQLPDKAAIGLAPVLLALADEMGLSHLQARALDFMTDHSALVIDTPAFKNLSKQQTDLAVAHACRRVEQFQDLLSMMIKKGGPY